MRPNAMGRSLRLYIFRRLRKPSPPSSPRKVHETLALGGSARKSSRVSPVMLPAVCGPKEVSRLDEVLDEW